MIVKCVAAAIIILVDESKGQRPENLQGQRRKKVYTCDPVRQQRTYQIRRSINDYYNDRSYYQITGLHVQSPFLSMFFNRRFALLYASSFRPALSFTRLKYRFASALSPWRSAISPRAIKAYK